MPSTVKGTQRYAGPVGKVNRALVMLVGAFALAAALSTAPTVSTTVVTAALVIATLAIAIHAAAVFAVGPQTVGNRATAHAEPLSERPAPSHPSTAGLPLTRAPAEAIAAA